MAFNGNRHWQSDKTSQPNAVDFGSFGSAGFEGMNCCPMHRELPPTTCIEFLLYISMLQSLRAQTQKRSESSFPSGCRGDGEGYEVRV